MSDLQEDQPIHEPCDGCGALMDVTSFGPFDTVACPACSAETNVKKNFGTYRLEQRYAIGGMSVIFAGWDTTLDRRVAIKVLNEEFCNDEVRIQSFENEARLTAQVSHPNVVKVYAVGRAYGRFYLVMELLKGKSFEQTIAKRGALPEEEVLDIALQVAAGLRAAKRAGMIHRDVKPGNILIDQDGHARLLDFGLALITQDGRAQAEEVWATPYYVPPEALERGIEDFRSDIYAFGASLYHALAGRPPFESTTTSNSLLRRAKQTIPRLCKVAPWISPNTGEVIDRMMAFKPEHRWSSYGQVLNALERAKKTIGPKPATPVHSQTRLKRRKQSSHFGLIFIILLVALCTGLALWQPWKKKGSAPTTSENEVNLPEIEKEAFNPGGGSLLALSDSWKTSRESVRTREYEKAVEAFVLLSREPTLSGMPQVWASFEASIASALAGRPGPARKLVATSLKDLDALTKQRSLQIRYRKLAEVLRRIPPPSPNDFPEKPQGIIDWMGTFALALKHWEQGQWELALPAFAKVRSAQMPDELAWFRTYQDIADIYLADGQTLSRLKDLPPPQNAPEASAQIATIEDAAKGLQTNGRAVFNLRARQAHLAKIRQSFEKGPVVKNNSSWKDYNQLLSQMAKSCRFDDLEKLLAQPPRKAPAESLWAWRYLLRNAIAFTKDLSALENWTAQKENGQEISPVSCDASGLLLADGSRVLWKELKLGRLIADHAKSKRHAVSFAWLVGRANQAEELAEELAERDEDFRREWRRVIIGITQ